MIVRPASGQNVNGGVVVQHSLEALRVEAGMTHQDVADKLGVSRQTVMKWESGTVRPKGLVIYALAKLYDVEIDDIRVPTSFSFNND